VQASCPAEFTREYGCTEAEWLGWLPGAVRDCPLERPAPGLARVAIGSGRLDLSWRTLAPRKIASVQFPRQWVQFRFDSLDEANRLAFMRYFDLYMQRGGG
jgi:hypothetical protein